MGERFDCVNLVHRAQECSKEEFKHTVKQHLSGQETEPWEILYYKVYRSQLAVIESARETGALMLGTDKSRRALLGGDQCRFPGWGQLTGGKSRCHFALAVQAVRPIRPGSKA